ncbi:hypothetical protein AVEN_74636-1 [Araneus ventricosus]|uniref:Uncharacterized protein n=1 Tax=Araneus ventricosus TaxID=182803 RepID=A0A4Y2KAS5_ARAVE|nr:hypothetical protein AVEN_74636-1 [Araneus ventricosus]
MDTNNRLKSTLKGKITRLETYIKTVKTETDIIKLKVNLKYVTFLQKNNEELRGNYYPIPNVKEAEIVTKWTPREVRDENRKIFILQVVGRIFHPLGLITPFTIRVKCLIQDQWSEKIPWDDPLPTHIEKEWKRWCEELPHLENLKIPRLVLDSTLDKDIVALHGFCDPSEKAYDAAIYLKSRT